LCVLLEFYKKHEPTIVVHDKQEMMVAIRVNPYLSIEKIIAIKMIM